MKILQMFGMIYLSLKFMNIALICLGIRFIYTLVRDARWY